MTETRSSQGQEQYASDFNKSKERQKAYQKAVVWLNTFIAIGFITACQDSQINIPFLNKPPTPTATPTKVPEQLITATAIPPTETPKPTPTKTPVIPTPKPTPPIYPWQLLTPEPFPTRPPTPTSTPTPAEAIIPAPYSEPVPTPVPYPQPNSIPTEVPASELRVGDPPLNFTRCFNNDIKPGEIKKRSVDFESTGLQTQQKTYPGKIENIKREASVPLTQKEIQAKKAKDPNFKETTKIVRENASFDVDEITTCVTVKMSLFPGSSDDCYRTLALNYRAREGHPRDNLFNKTTILENFCTGFVLKGKIKEEFYEYDPATNTLTTVVAVENPAATPQDTTLKLGKPCSFLEFAEQTVRIGSTDSRVFPDNPQTIPPKTTVLFVWKSKYPYGRQPLPPHYCTLYLKPTLPK